jgi:hypothetical protein
MFSELKGLSYTDRAEHCEQMPATYSIDAD